MSDELMELPEGWEWATLGETFNVYVGATPSRKILAYWGGSIPWVSSGEVAFCEIHETRETITELGLQNTSTEVHPPGTVLLGMIGEGKTRGQAAILKISASHNQNSAAIRVSEFGLIPEYVYHFLEQEYERTRQAGSGNNQPALNKSRVQVMGFPLPPLNEQGRIVAKIEELRERSQKARSHLSAIPNLCDKFRQSVLAAAFRGDLTADWREQNPDVEPASVLLERVRLEHRKRWEIAELERMKARGKEPRNDKWKEKYLELEDPAISTSTDFPEGWAWTTIGHVAECLDSKRIPINKEEREKRQGDIPYYGANGQVGWIDDFIFDDPLVILVEDETFIGRTKPFCYKITGKSWVNNHAHVLRATEALDIDYLNYSLMFYPFIPLTSGTTGRRKLTQGALMSAPYALPPLDEQRQIVAAIEQYFETIERTQQVLNSDFNLIAQLDRSILAKAFRGELVEQEPNDEPASILLERIRAEREQQAQGKAKKPGKKGQRTIKTDPP